MALLPSCAESTDQLDRQLAAALTVAMAARPSTPSATAMKDQPTLRSAQLRASRGETLPWSQWARLTKPRRAPHNDNTEARRCGKRGVQSGQTSGEPFSSKKKK